MRLAVLIFAISQVGIPFAAQGLSITTEQAMGGHTMADQRVESKDSPQELVFGCEGTRDVKHYGSTEDVSFVLRRVGNAERLQIYNLSEMKKFISESNIFISSYEENISNYDIIREYKYNLILENNEINNGNVIVIKKDFLGNYYEVTPSEHDVINGSFNLITGKLTLKTKNYGEDYQDRSRLFGYIMYNAFGHNEDDFEYGWSLEADCHLSSLR